VTLTAVWRLVYFVSNAERTALQFVVVVVAIAAAVVAVVHWFHVAAKLRASLGTCWQFKLPH
jgi:hypothetical protein